MPHVCAECGMPVTPNEYHPYAACLMFRGCRDAAVVRANLTAVQGHGPLGAPPRNQPTPSKTLQAAYAAATLKGKALEISSRYPFCQPTVLAAPVAGPPSFKHYMALLEAGAHLDTDKVPL